MLGGTELELTDSDQSVEGGGTPLVIAVGDECLLEGEGEKGGDCLAHAHILSSGKASQAETLTNLGDFGRG